MLITNQHPLNKSVSITLLGVTNIGKSLLMNNLIKYDLAVVTPKVQTTINRCKGIIIEGHTELVFIDTPGLHRSNKEFNKRINHEVALGIEEGDLPLVVIDSTQNISSQIAMIKDLVKNTSCFIVFTKKDLMTDFDFDKAFNIIKNDLVAVKYFTINNLSGEGIDLLRSAICEVAPSSVHYYQGELSNRSERFFASEYIREQLYTCLSQELPYESTVLIESFKEEDEGDIVARIEATIIVNKPGQRMIVVGAGGSMIKKIGTAARIKIEQMLGGKIVLKLHVKSVPLWFNNNMILEKIGLYRAPNSNRVWRSL